MVLPVPSEMTASVGGILTAAQWNTNVRDGINFLANPPICVASQATAQAIPTSASTRVAFDTNIVDTYSGHSTSVNNSLYVAQVAGYYFGLFDIAYPTNATGIREAVLLVNLGTSSPPFRNVEAPAGNTELQAAGLMHLNVGDSLSVAAFQTSGSSLTLANAAMALFWVHA